MSVVPTNVAASIAGVPHAETAHARQRERAEKAQERRPARRGDEVVVQTEAPEAVRSLAGNTGEEGREDRQAHPQYEGREKPAQGASIDVRG